MACDSHDKRKKEKVNMAKFYSIKSCTSRVVFAPLLVGFFFLSGECLYGNRNLPSLVHT